MSTNINIVVKDKDTPVPDTGVITPDTGRYTNTNSNSTSMEGGMIAFTIILSSLLLLSIALIFFSRLFRKKAINTTTNSTTKKANLFRTLGLLLFIFTTTTGIVANILRNNSFSTYATDTPLDITTSDTTITVVREDGPAYAVASAEITLNEATPAGYNLYVYGPDGNQFTSTTTTATIDTVAEHNSIISNNTYGVANTTNEPLITDAVWNPVGDTEDNAELIATSSNATNVGDKITIYYGILVDETFPAGIYTGSIEYKAYTRTYTITYDANGGTINNEETKTEYIERGSNITTLPTPEREGYTFKGWFTTEQTTDDDEPITTDAVPTEDVTYYAKWVRNTYNITFDPTGGYVIGAPTAIINTGDTLGNNIPSADGLGSYYGDYDKYVFLGWFTEPDGGGAKINAATIPDKDTIYYAYWEELILQNPAAVAAELSRIGQSYDVRDIRDGRYYTVGRLADGKIWFLENLALNPRNSNINSDNTNASSESLDALLGGSDGGDNGSLARNAILVKSDESSVPYDDFYALTTSPIVDIRYRNMTMDQAYATASEYGDKVDSKWEVGAYYNYCAASAGSYCYGDGSGTGDATEDICPAGWRMPTGDVGGDYSMLLSELDDHFDDFRDSLMLPLSGYSLFSDDTISSLGLEGNWWSSTEDADYNAAMINLYIQEGGNGLGASSRYHGFSVRCVMKEQPLVASGISFQDTATINNALPNNGDTIVVTDERDDKNYTVGRLADGKIWLLDNLDLDLTMEDAEQHITRENTNATSASLNALFNGDGVEQYARSRVSTNWDHNSSSDPRIDTSQSEKNGMYYSSVGTYYNFCAASAGSYCYEYSSAPKGVNATEDICPTGWRMPTGYNGGDYNWLYSLYGNDNVRLFREILRVPLSGFFSNESGDNPYDLGIFGSFWSSSLYGVHEYGHYKDGMYYLHIGQGDYVDYSVGDRYEGFSVRCVMKEQPLVASGISFQDTATINNALPNNGDTIVVTDERDNKNYTVGRLADGRVWLLDNLDLDLTMEDAEQHITEENTNAKPDSLNALFNGDSNNNSGKSSGAIESYSHEWWGSSEKPIILNSRSSQTGTDYLPVGIYYNYCAASAGSYCYDRTYSGDGAEEDICPAGWRMPTGGGIGEYGILSDAYKNGNGIILINDFRAAFRPPLSGHFYYTFPPESFGSYGSFWSSSPVGIWGGIYSLQVSNQAVSPSGSYYRYSGMSVRCIMDQ